MGNREWGIGTEDGTKITEQELELFSSIMASNFGAVSNKEFKTIGKHDVIVMQYEEVSKRNFFKVSSCIFIKQFDGQMHTIAYSDFF